jgi:hypothetical protein
MPQKVESKIEHCKVALGLRVALGRRSYRGGAMVFLANFLRHVFMRLYYKPASGGDIEAGSRQFASTRGVLAVCRTCPK